MSQFTDFVSIRPLPKSNEWITTKDFKFYIDDDCIGEYIQVECGFRFDGCSIPVCIFGAKISSKTISACCLHDFLWRKLKKKYSFTSSNLIFYRALKANGVGLLKSLRYALGVQIFGYPTYFLKK